MVQKTSSKILFIKLFQPYAQYRNPMTFYYAQSFPLPPKTTVIGFFQNITRKFYEEDFWHLEVSIHGGFESRFWNLQQLIGTKRITFEKIDGRYFIFIEAEIRGKKRVSKRFPLYSTILRNVAKAYRGGTTRQEELFNGHIYLFVKGDTELLNSIYNSIRKPWTVLRLGRSEDVVYIRNIHWLKTKDLEEKVVESSLRIEVPTYIKLSHNGERLPLTNESLHSFPTYMIPIRHDFYILKGLVRRRVKMLGELLSTKFSRRQREVDFETVIWTGFHAWLEFNQPVNVYFVKISGEKFVFPIIDRFGWL